MLAPLPSDLAWAFDELLHGSARTTPAAGHVLDLFGEERITCIALDDYHSLDRRQRGLVGLTALNPRANNFALMETALLLATILSFVTISLILWLLGPILGWLPLV